MSGLGVMNTVMSPFCSMEMSASRVGSGFFEPCPHCGRLIRSKYTSKKDGAVFAVVTVIDCPDCGTFEIVANIEGGNVSYHVASTGETYDRLAHINGLEQRVDEAGGDDAKLALLYAEAAWEDLCILVRDVKSLWSTAVDHMVRVLNADTSHIREFASWVVRFLPIKDKEVMYDTMRACQAVVGAVQSPASPEECVVWMAYSIVYSDPGLDDYFFDLIDFQDCDQFEELLTSIFSVAYDGSERLIDGLCPDMPLFPIIRCICRNEFYTSEGRGHSYNDEGYLEELVDITGKVMDCGAEMVPALFMKLQDEWTLYVSSDWNESDGIEKISELKGRMGWYDGVLEGYLKVLEAGVRMNGEFSTHFLLFRGALSNEPESGDISLMEDGIRQLERYSLDVMGRSIITAYSFLTFARKETLYMGVAVSYAESLRNNLIDDDGSVEFLGRVLEQLPGGRDMRSSGISRPGVKKEKKPSKKDRVAARKAAHKAKRR